MSAARRPARPPSHFAARPVLIAALASTACTLGRGESAPTLESKRVQAKAEPHHLQAEDGTWCTVRPDKYKSAAVGEHAWCAWQRSGGDRRHAPAW